MILKNTEQKLQILVSLRIEPWYKQLNKPNSLNTANRFFVFVFLKRRTPFLRYLSMLIILMAVGVKNKSVKQCVGSYITRQFGLIRFLLTALGAPAAREGGRAFSECTRDKMKGKRDEWRGSTLSCKHSLLHQQGQTQFSCAPHSCDTSQPSLIWQGPRGEGC